MYVYLLQDITKGYSIISKNISTTLILEDNLD